MLTSKPNTAPLPMVPPSGRPLERPIHLADSVPGRVSPRTIACIYLLVAGAWILLSDSILATLVADADARLFIGGIKGELFVLVTAALLYAALARNHQMYVAALGAARESEARYRQVFDACPRPVWVFDDETLRFLAVNRASCHAYGYTADEFACMRVSDIRPGEDIAGMGSAVAPDQADGARRWRHVRKDGGEQTVEIVTSRLEFAGRLARMEFIIDVTDKLRDEEQLKLSAVAFANLAEAVAVLNEAGGLVSVNKAFENLTRFDAAEVLGKPARTLVASGSRRIRQTLAGAGAAAGELWCKRKGADPFLVEYAIRAAPRVRGAPRHLVVVARDVSAQKAAEARIHALAYYDTLTGLPNRNLLEDRVRQTVALHEPTGAPFALMFVDLDNFKAINDSLGYLAGDYLLQTAARHIDSAVNDDCTPARWGGDEFVVVMPASDGEKARGAARRILKALSAPVSIEGRLVAVSASIGIAVFPTNGADFEGLLKSAGSAAQQAKERGRNGFHFYHEPLMGEGQEHVVLAGALRHALDAGHQLRVLYQPQLNLHTGRVVGLEALARWDHPELGLVTPDRFIRVAETSGAMPTLGDWMLRQACEQCRLLVAAGWKHARVAVNVSVVQLHDADFARRCLAIIDACGIAPGSVELEVTESVLLQDGESVARHLSRLRERGVGIAIDDFGTGFSSLSYLRQLPVDTIKIDQSFISDMAQGPDACSIVQVIIGLAHKLRLKCVAEGVETKAQYLALARFHCDHAQGHFIAPAMEAPALRDWLQQHGNKAEAGAARALLDAGQPFSPASRPSRSHRRRHP